MNQIDLTVTKLFTQLELLEKRLDSLQKEFAISHNSQHVLNEKLIQNIEGHSQELTLILQRIVALWEIVMKPIQN